MYADICKIPQYLRILLETVLVIVRNRLETGLGTVANYIDASPSKRRGKQGVSEVRRTRAK